MCEPAKSRNNPGSGRYQQNQATFGPTLLSTRHTTRNATVREPTAKTTVETQGP